MRNIISIILLALLIQGRLAAQDTIELSLEDSTRMALKNSLDIQIIQYDALIEKTKEGSARSIYDTMFESKIGYHKDKRQRTSTILGSEIIDNDYNVSLSKKVPTGTDVSVSLDNNRNKTDSSFSTSPITHTSTLGFNVSQDLGKNFLGIKDRHQVKVTLKEIDNAQFISRLKIEETVADVQKNYWRLVLEQEKLNIKNGMAEQARLLYELHKNKLATGLIELPEQLASEANYQNRLNELRGEENNRYLQANRLKLLLNITEDEVLVTAKDSLDAGREILDLKSVMEDAFKNRQDYQTALNNVKIQELKLTLSKNSLWPEINLSATLKRNGLGDHFPQSVRQTTHEDHPEFLAALTVKVPLENNEAKSKLKEDQLKKAQTLVALKRVERTIAVEIMDQVRTVSVLGEVADNSRIIAQLQEKKYVEEEKRFNYGRSSTDMIIRYQEDVIKARETAVMDAYYYRVSLVDLKLKQGVILTDYLIPGI